MGDAYTRAVRQELFPEHADARADRAAERAAELASKGKTDEALVMVLLAIDARLEALTENLP